MADSWDEYIKRQQSGQAQQPVPQQADNPFFTSPLFGSMFGGRPQPQQQQGVIGPDSKGMYTPSLGQMPVGPATPINYGAMRGLLNSGVLRNGGQVAQPQPMPQMEAAPAPAPVQQKKQGLLDVIFGALSGGFNR